VGVSLEVPQIRGLILEILYVRLLRDWKYLATVLLSMESLMLRKHERLWLKGVRSSDAQTS
jgi:hypothetical protein